MRSQRRGRRRAGGRRRRGCRTTLFEPSPDSWNVKHAIWTQRKKVEFHLTMWMRVSSFVTSHSNSINKTNGIHTSVNWKRTIVSFFVRREVITWEWQNQRNEKLSVYDSHESLRLNSLNNGSFPLILSHHKILILQRRKATTRTITFLNS